MCLTTYLLNNKSFNCSVHTHTFILSCFNVITSPEGRSSKNYLNISICLSAASVGNLYFI